MKIILTKEEAREYSLDLGDTVKDTQRSRRILWRVLDDARKSVSFDPSGDKVLVQLYPMKEGGCEIFVTKLGILSEASARLVSDSDRITLLSKSLGFYLFASAEDLHRAARAIKNHPSGIIPKGDLYYVDNVGYVLMIEEYVRGRDGAEFMSILEFGKKLSAELASYISEHGNLLFADNALDMISASE